MLVEATDVDQPFETEPQDVPQDAEQDTSQDIAQDIDEQSPPKRGRPADSKDKQRISAFSSAPSSKSCNRAFTEHPVVRSGPGADWHA